MCLLWKNKLQRLCIENDCSPCNALYNIVISREINTMKNINQNNNNNNNTREYKTRLLRSANDHLCFKWCGNIGNITTNDHK